MFELRALASDRFLREIHHLLWMDPHVNKGTLDVGWNCRDHAWVTGILIGASGHKPVFFHGKATYILRRTARSKTRIIQQGLHSWVGTENHGLIDLSIKSKGTIDGEPYRLPSCIFANKWMPSDGGTVNAVRDEATFAREIDMATKGNKATAVYLIKEAELLSANFLLQADAWINSPLTEKLKTLTSDVSELYCSILLHLIHFLRNEAQSLTTMTQSDALIFLAREAKAARSQVEILLKQED